MSECPHGKPLLARCDECGDADKIREDTIRSPEAEAYWEPIIRERIAGELKADADKLNDWPETQRVIRQAAEFVVHPTAAAFVRGKTQEG